MGSQPMRDRQSPSASSTFLIPQLRQSRRGSLASLSSTSQLDKEALSQALDQIHSSASQTETLTTFNEYTSPPSSSSGPDSKGITSELHGGLSGLYTRFRASVGNVKEIVHLGSEEPVGDTISSANQKGSTKSPASSTKNLAQSGLITSSASTALQDKSTSSLGQHSVAGTADSETLNNEVNRQVKSSKISLGSLSSKSASGSLGTLKSAPATLTQAAQTSTIRPALAEVNISAVKQGFIAAELPPHSASKLPNEQYHSDGNARAQNGIQLHTSNRASNASAITSDTQLSSTSTRSNGDQQAVPSDSDRVKSSAPSFYGPTSDRRGEIADKKQSKGHVQPFPGLEDDRYDKDTYAVTEASSDTDDDRVAPPRLITSYSKGQDDTFEGSERKEESGKAQVLTKKGGYQHLALPLRKTLAPPMVSRTDSTNPSLSRASSYETSTDSVIDPVLRPSPTTEFDKAPETPKGNIIGPRSTNQSASHQDLRTMNVFSQVKNKVLNKEYWMKDENARDCFYCGDSFTMVRRKHHCSKSIAKQYNSQKGMLNQNQGTCGQIFDAKCTSIISGQHFGQPGRLRVCKPCEGIINGEDDSSEFSDDGSVSARGIRPRHGSTGASDVLGSPHASPSPTRTRGPYRGSKALDLSVPTMSIPATRKAGNESSRKPTVLEIDVPRTLTRPSSSRSLKSSFVGKSYHSGHRRQNSRNLLQRGFKPVNEDDAPFHQNPADDKARSRRLPTFHDDNIIDPDLAPYLSDEASTGDEQVSIMAALNGEGLSRSFESERHAFGGLASLKKARSKMGDKSIGGVLFASRDADNYSLNSSTTTNIPRSSKRRNLSIAGNMHLRPSPRSYRASPAAPTYSFDIRESSSSSALAQAGLSIAQGGGTRMIRSSSMRGAAAPAVELNSASLRHVRKLLHQLLQDSKVSNVASWEKALVPILLRATDDVNPDVQNGDDIDIRHYVKLKKIPGGRPGDTSYVSGLVFTKNLALKGMPRSIPHPNILILTFPLEYARHQQHFMSLEPVIKQEREFLQNLVNRIAALRPQLLLVERSVSGLALQYLEQANIATAYNVKASVLEAVSRCCQTRIISSIDKLTVKPAQAGKCAAFYLKTYVNNGRRKTYMFLSGCAKELGCTIVLRGAEDATLAKMKRITEFMIYVVYNLKLETCLMRDEFAAIPANTEIGSLSPGTDTRSKLFKANELGHQRGMDFPSPMMAQNILGGDVSQESKDSDTSITRAQHVDKTSEEKPKASLPDEDSVPEDIPMPTFYGDMVEEHKTKILSASPFVKFMQPYLLMRAREQERRLAYLKRLRDQDGVEEQNMDEKVKPQKFDLITPEMVHERVHTASRKVREVLHAVHDAEYDKALHNYQTQSKQWETYIAGNNNLFDPFAHQNIAVLYSVVCTVTTVPCSGPDLLALGFYNEHETDADFEADCTLGQYVEDLCLGANTVCTANGCERKMLDHHRQYVHGEAQLSVFVERYPCRLRGLQGTILMWSTCRICNKETQVLPMSENTWKYSFGKYLELSFWSSELHARADVCPHDLHRDHLRYFGFKDMALRVHYDPITLLEIIVPRARITWKVDNDLRFRNDVFTKIEDRLNRYLVSVKSRIKSINIESVVPEKTESCKLEVEKLSKRASDEHHALVQKLREKYMDSKYYEIIPLNRVIRAVQEKVAEWDNAFADFDQNFFPSDTDIRRLTALQLKKIFMDRDASATTVTSTEDNTTTTSPEEALTEKPGVDFVATLTPQTRQMSPEKAQDMLAAVVENNGTADRQPGKHQSAPGTAVPVLEPEVETTPHIPTEGDVRHLDLAMSTERLQHSKSAPIDDQKPKAVRDSGEGIGLTSTQPETDNYVDANMSSTDNGSKGANQVAAGPSRTIEASQMSGIPRPVDAHQRNMRPNVSPPLSRTQSQPAHLRNNPSTSSSHSSVATPQTSASSNQSPAPGANQAPLNTGVSKPVDKKLSDRLGFNALKQTTMTAQSMIPRSIASRRNDSKVSNLAKHFEQLSREFEKERIRERRQRAAKSRQARAYPMAASKPIVQVYRNVHEAVEEREPSDEDLLSSDPSHLEQENSPSTINHMVESTADQTPGEGFHAEEVTAENTETDEKTLDSRAGSDVEGDENRSDEEQSVLDDIQILGTADEHHALSPEEAQLDIKLDLPKHEKNSIMKMLTNFWAERSASGWQPLDYPLNTTDHIFADSDIIVREDEPSSLIAFALGSRSYQEKLRSISRSEGCSGGNEDSRPQSPASTPEQVGVEESLLRPTGTHVKYQFAEGSAKMLCKVFYAEQFDAVRRKCGVSERIVESLSRCMKWDSKGGKTKSVFLKTLDDRFVLKSLAPIETQAFLRFAPAYFRIMSESLFHELPSVIAKMLGFYQIIIKNPATGIEFNWFLLVMENLFYDRSPTRIFDLKGSMRNRRIQSTGEQNEVLLDENMVEFIYESPLFAREHSKKLLRASVWNDTLFLSRQNVMDYSLMIAIDENRKELVVGIIDCIRTYTWDKKLETWIKDRGKNKPTVTSPKEYKARFREAMGRYVLQAPK